MILLSLYYYFLVAMFLYVFEWAGLALAALATVATCFWAWRRSQGA